MEPDSMIFDTTGPTLMIERAKRSTQCSAGMCPHCAPRRGISEVFPAHRLGADEVTCKPDIAGTAGQTPFSPPWAVVGPSGPDSGPSSNKPSIARWVLPVLAGMRCV